MNDPIAVAMSGQKPEFVVGGTMTVDVSVPPETGNVVYVWYLNGISVAAGTSYTTPTDLIAGVYSTDVTAFTTDGSRAGSTTYTFRVLDLDQDSNWNLVFEDEFNGTSLDTNKWTTCYWWDRDGCTNLGNNELEWYQPDDVLVCGGTVKLRAQRREITAWDGTTYDYTSGMITTGRESSDKTLPAKFLFQYGYAEIRARIPMGKGLWPAFWLLPATHISRPEIDVMEILGDEPNTVHMNFHYLNADESRGDSGKVWTGTDFFTGWHTIAVDWQPDYIIWYVDGIERWRFMDAARVPSEPLYLIANLAVGGDWPGSPDASTPFPSYFEIDYIRVWTREN